MTLYACMDGKSIYHLPDSRSLPSLFPIASSDAKSGRVRQRARAFVQRIMEFEFDTLVPAHFLAPVPGGREALAEAFKFLL